MEEKISVIVPVFNSEPYLEKCLDSILCQSCKNIEVILVNDGSVDRSGVICDGFAHRDSRVIVVHKENGGPSSARNAGIERARGAWVTFVDSDDYIERDLCGYLLRLAQLHDADIVQCGTFEERHGQVRTVLCAGKDIVITRGAGELGPKEWRCFGNQNWGKLYRQDLIGEARFDTGCSIGEDLHFNFQMLMRAERIVLGDRAKYHYMLRDSSLSRAVPSHEGLLDCRRMLERAQTEFAGNQAVLNQATKEQYRNDLDICSKIVCFQMKDEEDVQKMVQCEIRKHMGLIMGGRSFSGAEKLKFLLIAYAWPVYCRLLLWRKRKEGSDGLRIGWDGS